MVWSERVLLVPTLLGPSPIEGLGLFAAAPIAKGTLTWRLDRRFDLVFTPTEVEAMPPLQQQLVRRYGYLSLALNAWVYCADDARFWNHAARPNNTEVVLAGEAEPANVAARDIAAGEELTLDYRAFDANDASSDAAWLRKG